MNSKLPSFRLDAPSGYRYRGGKLLPSRDTVMEFLDRAFVNGEAEIELGSANDADHFAAALCARAELLTGDERTITLWGCDEARGYRLRACWVSPLSLPRRK